MTFDEFWNKVKNTGLLSDMAIKQIPECLSEGTKNQIKRHAPEKVAAHLVSVIDEINRGSVETIETLLRKRL